MPRGNYRGSRGHKGGHKGQKRHFTNPDELERMKEKEEKERKWREKHGELESSSSSDEEEPQSAAKKSEHSGSSSSSSSSSEESDDESKQGQKGTEGLIEIENPNRVASKAKKVSQLEVVEDTKTELSRREREELEKQRARMNYLKMHAAGKTEEARADLARLAIIKKQREEAAKKREEEKKARDAVKAEKKDSINKALGKGRKT